MTLTGINNYVAVERIDDTLNIGKLLQPLVDIPEGSVILFLETAFDIQVDGKNLSVIDIGNVIAKIIE